jgi:hypothetical protein
MILYGSIKQEKLGGGGGGGVQLTQKIYLYICIDIIFTFVIRGPRWRSWLRHCTTNQKVTGSIPDGVIAIFHWRKPFSHTTALGSTQPLTKMSTRNISCGERRPVRRADNLTTFKCRLSGNLGASNSWKPQGLSRPVMGLLYLFTFVINTILLLLHVLHPWFSPINISNHALTWHYIPEGQNLQLLYSANPKLTNKF